MKIRFWGTRGSIPTPGPETVRFGGNTPCVEVRFPNGDLVILDAGTGIRPLGEELIASGQPIKAYLAITHPHWDHIQGFPFFRPLYIPGNELTILGPQSDRYDMKQVVSDLMNKTYFPVKLDELRARINFARLTEETVPVFGGTLTSCLVNHPSVTMGYRIEAAGKSVVYISDNEPVDPENPESIVGLDGIARQKFLAVKGDPNLCVYDFVRNADVLIHDSTYTSEEYVHRVGWGHSPVTFSIKVAREAGVRTLVLFHHDHTHTDERVDAIMNHCRRVMEEEGDGFECVAAKEGMVLDL